jgi:hypothetical protein
MHCEKYNNQDPLDPATIYLLPEMDPADEDVAHLLTTIKKRKIPINTERRNSGVGRSTTFGIAYKKFQGHEYKWCVNNTKYSELYEAILKVGRKICPVPFYAIQVNHNYSALPHYDMNNIGHSVIVSIGDYTGGDFCVKNGDISIDLNINYKPVLVDATKNLHWVTEITSGDRYSFVFFTGKPIGGKNPSDVGEIYKV